MKSTVAIGAGIPFVSKLSGLDQLANFSYETFEDYTIGRFVPRVESGNGWDSAAIVRLSYYSIIAVETFEEFTEEELGVNITTFGESSEYWETAAFLRASYLRLISEDNFESYENGAIVNLNGGDGWSSEGIVKAGV